MGAAEPRSALWLLLCPLVCAAHPADHFNLSEIKSGVFVHAGRQLALDVPGHDDIANIGFIVGKRCVAVIDSGGSVSTGRALRSAVAEHTELPICYLINTHVHADHVLGNAAFKPDRPSFVGHAALTQAMVRSRDFFITEYGADLDAPPTAEQIVGPDRPVESDLTLDLGSRRLALRAWPTAHTDCDLTVYDAQSGTLWTGDLLFRDRLPALDGSVKGWLKALDEIARMRVSVAVPGHGPVTRDLPAALKPERRYLQSLTAGVRDAIARGKSPQDAIEHVAAAEKPHWLLWDSVHPHNVMRAIQELEWD